MIHGVLFVCVGFWGSGTPGLRQYNSGNCKKVTRPDARCSSRQGIFNCGLTELIFMDIDAMGADFEFLNGLGGI